MDVDAIKMREAVWTVAMMDGVRRKVAGGGGCLGLIRLMLVWTAPARSAKRATGGRRRMGVTRRVVDFPIWLGARIRPPAIMPAIRAV